MRLAALTGRSRHVVTFHNAPLRYGASDAEIAEAGGPGTWVWKDHIFVGTLQEAYEAFDVAEVVIAGDWWAWVIRYRGKWPHLLRLSESTAEGSGQPVTTRTDILQLSSDPHIGKPGSW